MGRSKKPNMTQLILIFNNNFVRLDYTSKESFENSYKNQKNKIDDIINQIHLFNNSQKSQENKNASTDPSNNNNNIEPNNPNTIKSNQREDLQPMDGIFSSNDFSQHNFSEDENDELFFELDSDSLEQSEEMFNWFY